MLTALLSIVAILQELPALFDPAHQAWNIGLIAIHADAIAAGNWFGGPQWAKQEGVAYRSTRRNDVLACQFLHQDESGASDLRFEVSRGVASVQLNLQGDVMLGPLQDVGGLVCLVVEDGRRVVLEYEVYGVYGGYYIRAFAGAMDLDGSEADFALELSKRGLAEGPSLMQELVRTTSQEDRSYCQGYNDGLGRKQGPWTVHQLDGSSIQVGWRDGVPHGSLLCWDEKGRLRSLRYYRAGLQEGESMEWTESGVLRSWESPPKGHGRGEQFVFHPNGAKSIEVSRDGHVVKRCKWSDEGALLEQEENREPVPPRSIQEKQEAIWEWVAARFAAMRTRPTY